MSDSEQTEAQALAQRVWATLLGVDPDDPDAEDSRVEVNSPLVLDAVAMVLAATAGNLLRVKHTLLPDLSRYRKARQLIDALGEQAKRIIDKAERQHRERASGGTS